MDITANLLLLSIAGLLLALSPKMMEAAAGAAEVFARGVLPALFPMMVLSKCAPPAKGGPRAWVTAALFSFLSGSPASAQRVAALAEQEALAPASLPALLALTGVMSPMFFMGTLAASTGQRSACWLLLAAHWLSAGLAGAAVWATGRRRKPSFRPPAANRAGESKGASLPKIEPFPTRLVGAVNGAAQAMLAVCGSMMLFSMLACGLRWLLEKALPGTGAARPELLAALWALLEIGGGSYALLDACPAPPLALLCALCSFGGLSIWLQNLLFVGKIIRPGRLLLLRALHGAVAYLVCGGLLRLFPQAAAAFGPLGAAVGRAGLQSLPALALGLIFLAWPRHPSCP